MTHIVYFAPPTADLSIPYPTLLAHTTKAQFVVSPTLNPAVTLVVTASSTAVPANIPKSATCVSPQEFVDLAISATPSSPAAEPPHLTSTTTAPSVKRVHTGDDEEGSNGESHATSPKRARSIPATDPAAHVVVFTGTLPSGRTRGEATAEAEEHGYTVKNSITKATTILVFGDKAGAKIEQARKQGVEVLSEAEWTARLGGGEPGCKEDMDVDDKSEQMEKPKPTKSNTKPAVTAKSTATAATASTSSEDPAAHTVVFTGTLPSGRSRDEAIKHAESLGYTAKNTITKATTILVYGDKAGSKIEKAREQGVLVLSEAEWIARVGQGPAGEEGGDGKDEAEPEDKKPAPKTKAAAAALKKTAPAATPATASGEPKKGVVVFSGTLPSRTRSDATREAEEAGYEVKNSITKATTLLVTGEKGGSKIDKARELGIEVIDADTWIARLAVETEAEI